MKSTHQEPIVVCGRQTLTNIDSFLPGSRQVRNRYMEDVTKGQFWKIKRNSWGWWWGEVRLRQREQHKKEESLGERGAFRELYEVWNKWSAGNILGWWGPKLKKDHQNCIMQHDVCLEFDGEIFQEFLTLK